MAKKKKKKIPPKKEKKKRKKKEKKRKVKSRRINPASLNISPLPRGIAPVTRSSLVPRAGPLKIPLIIPGVISDELPRVQPIQPRFRTIFEEDPSLFSGE